jgi:hypothetical protein
MTSRPSSADVLATPEAGAPVIHRVALRDAAVAARALPNVALEALKRREPASRSKA